VKEISQNKGETISAGICYITMEISYIIHALRRNGTKAQRHNGTKAQRHNGATVKKKNWRMEEEVKGRLGDERTRNEKILSSSASHEHVCILFRGMLLIYRFIG
jgi:hypothetical protein